ncbi:MAG: hypothetical protein J7502_09560 [Flavisolibacter sp.]|nr:hypothetical protein [Flavisolibacter sp.]
MIETDIYKDMPVKTIAAFDYLLKNKINDEIKTVLDFIAEIDVNIAVGQVAEVKGLPMPKPCRRLGSLQAVDLKHPCIDKAIGNTIEMKMNSNVIFLTGANMAGKSTWMKSIGISMYLAHIGDLFQYQCG